MEIDRKRVLWYTGARENEDASVRFAKRILGTDVGAEFKAAPTDSMTILLTVGFAAVTAGVYKYLDVRHDRNVESCKCPYCLQVYKQTGVIINDDLDRRNVYTLAHTPRCTDQEPIILTEPLRFVYKSFRELPFLNFSWYYSPTGQ